MNVSKRTIDYYTQIGLLDPQRTESNYRLYGEEAIHVLELVEHYKRLNMPLDEIKNSIELIKSLKDIDPCKLKKHFDQIADIMQHLEAEIREMKPILENLNDQQKATIMRSISPTGVTLAQTLLLLFS